jgi:UPF0755 protein
VRPRALVAAGCLALAACGGPAADAPAEHIIVPRHTTLAAVTDSLVAHRIVTSPRGFRFVARVLGTVSPKLRGVDRRLRAGRYEFPVGEKWTVILGALITGRTDDEFLSVPEGVRSVEGYLFPAVYRVAFDAEPQQLVAQMVRQFLLVWDTAWDRLARDSLGMTRHEVLTLASIVEAEARVARERPMIAGVYLNRLRRRTPMKLEADPTVIYALGAPVRRVLFRHLRIDSPYNTYLHYGLPPGPIASPGRASILAVLHPARHPYLFFVARPDGTHMFSGTAGAHVDSVVVARRLRAEWVAAHDTVAGAPPP